MLLSISISALLYIIEAPGKHSLGVFILFIILLASRVVGASSNQVISTNNGGPWGSWRNEERCPRGQYAGGFSVRVSMHISFCSC